MKKSFVLLLIMISMLLCSCKDAESELYAHYMSGDSIVNTDIGQYITPKTAPLLSEGKLCYVTKEQLSEDENLNCKASIVINITNNTFYQGDNSFGKIYPASITKLMTALVILKYGNLEDEYLVKEDNCGITEEGAQLIGLEAGDTIKVRDLMYCLLLHSGNDSAYALADYLTGDQAAFCDLLNEEAKRLGCVSTHYTNPHGLHNDNHYSSAYDEYIILRECMQSEDFVNISKCDDYEFTLTDSDGVLQTIYLRSTNKFKRGDYEIPEGTEILGYKTGYTDEAGVCLIQCVQTQNGDQYIIGIFGGPSYESLYTQMQYLMEKVNAEGVNDL